jgi:membrane-associated phospholipid phosphatase
MMALVTIGPTRLDCGVAKIVEDHATPALERPLERLTYAADEHVLYAAALGFWLFSRGTSPRQRQAADYLALNVAISAVLPHILKTLVNQQRPDRRVHGRRHGVPVSGNAEDAFPSGHAVHVGAVASALSRYDPRWTRLSWSVGGALAATRVILLAHWTTDVLAGLALGVAVERITWSAWRRPWRRPARGTHG